MVKERLNQSEGVLSRVLFAEELLAELSDGYLLP